MFGYCVKYANKQHVCTPFYLAVSRGVQVPVLRTFLNAIGRGKELFGARGGYVEGEDA